MIETVRKQLVSAVFDSGDAVPCYGKWTCH